MNCKKTATDPPVDPIKSELYKLPAITTEGKNTFGCLVNGKAWIPKSEVLGIPEMGAGYSKTYKDLSIDARIWKKKIKEDFILSLVPVEFNGLDSFVIQNDSDGVSFANYTIGIHPNNIFYESVSGSLGYCKIIRFDSTASVVAGIFAFTAVSDQGDTVRVTNGRFDIHYAQ